MTTDPENIQSADQQIAELLQRIKEREDELNELTIKHNNLQHDYDGLAEEMDWMTRKYNELNSLAFNRNFDVCNAVRDRHLGVILEERRQDLAVKARAEANKQDH